MLIWKDSTRSWRLRKSEQQTTFHLELLKHFQPRLTMMNWWQWYLIWFVLRSWKQTDDDIEGGLYLARVNPYGIHVESMESISNSMWNPWNECWLRPQPIHWSMDIMDSIWNDHGMVMEWSIPYGIHHYSTWIPLDSIWNVGISTMDSMEQVHMELMTITFTVSLLF